MPWEKIILPPTPGPQDFRVVLKHVETTNLKFPSGVGQDGSSPSRSLSGVASLWAMGRH